MGTLLFEDDITVQYDNFKCLKAQPRQFKDKNNNHNANN